MVNESISANRWNEMARLGNGTDEEICEYKDDGGDMNMLMPYAEIGGEMYNALEIAMQNGRTMYVYKLMKAGTTVTKRAVEIAHDKCQDSQRNAEYATIYHMLTFEIDVDTFDEMFEAETERQLGEYDVNECWSSEIVMARNDEYSRYYRRRRDYLDMTTEEHMEMLYDTMGIE